MPRRPGLPRELWVVEAGVFLNMLGYGAVFPFELIYLHEARGFDLGLAGFVVGLLSAVAIAVAPLAGTAIDRVGARTTAAGAGIALAAGYATLAIATTPPVAIAAAALAGIGNGALQPSQSVLMIALAPRDLRQRATAVSRVATNAGIGLGAAIGGFVAGLGTKGFVVLLLANAATYLVYVAILVAAVRDQPLRGEDTPGGYRQVLRDRALTRFALINVALIAVGWGVLAWIVPPYARAIGIGSGQIGLLLLANAATVVLAQLPLVRVVEGRSRVRTLALASATWVVACVLAVAPHATSTAIAFACLLGAAVLFGIGECLYATAFIPLIADLAPPTLQGRYMATVGLSWWLGLAVAPTIGAQLLAVSPSLALLAAAALAAVTAVALLASESRLPKAVRLVPQPRAE